MSRRIHRVFVGLPAFNEEIAINRLLAKYQRLLDAHPHKFTILVYDDGSTDRTLEVATAWQSRLPIVLLGTKDNRGLGAGLRALVHYVTMHAGPDDALIVMDCDDTHDPSQIPEMINAAERCGDVIIASRFCKGAVSVGIPRCRRLTAYGAMLLLRTIHPIAGVLDYTCGYRLYRVALLQRATEFFSGRFVTEPGFASTAELLLRLNCMKPHVSEIPLRLRYDLKPTASKMKVGRHIWHLLRLAIVWRFSKAAR
jgi:dolichol-phosphate mannosyltransferase